MSEWKTVFKGEFRGKRCMVNTNGEEISAYVHNGISYAPERLWNSFAVSLIAHALNKAKMPAETVICVTPLEDGGYIRFIARDVDEPPAVILQWSDDESDWEDYCGEKYAMYHDLLIFDMYEEMNADIG